MVLYILLAVLTGTIIILLYLLFKHQKETVMLYEIILQKLDTAIGGNIQDTIYDESFDAAITERLNRMVQISFLQKTKAEEERDRVKSLISDISHQVRTPLSNILLYMELLKESPLDENALILTDKIKNNSNKLDFFIKELTKLSYTEQEIIALSLQEVSPEELVNRACQMTEMAALKKNIILNIETEEGLCYADTKWTVEAIGNVIENALKYSPEASMIQIHTIFLESFVCIQVKDTGIGILEEEQGKVFQRFYRGSNVKNSQGFGIGLYLAREVLSRQKGYIKLDSELGKGTIVSLFLSRSPI